MKLNYQLELDKVLDSIDKNQKPSLLLHSCCAPCSSYVLEYLSSYFNITIISLDRTVLTTKVIMIG